MSRFHPIPRVLPLVLLLILVPMVSQAAQATPSELVGISLGANAEDLRDRLDLSRMAPLWNRPWLIRANLKPTKGFTAGYVLCGGCATTNRVERIRLQYKDGSKALFDKLAATLTARYGKPERVRETTLDGYKGLRWIFGKSKKDGVDILLEHFDKGNEETPSGNIIRLSDNRAMAQERACHDTMLRSAPEPQPSFPLFTVDDSWLLPK